MNYFSDSKTLKGIQIKPITLLRIFETIKKYSEAEIKCSVSILIDGEEKKTNLDELNSKYKTLKSQPKQLRLSVYEKDESADESIRVKLLIDNNGEITISGNFHPKKSDELLALIWDELLLADEEYPNYAKSIVIPRFTKRIIEVLLISVSIFLLTQIFYLSYAKRVGVDLKDTSVIQKGNEYFNLVENALKSDSSNEKLNVLLIKELRGFTNVSEIIKRTKSLISILSIGVVIIFLAYILLLLLRKRFPLVYYNLSEIHTKRYDKIQKEREIIVISILIAFVINILSGIVLSLT
jgi:hypothetical protein